MGEMINELRDMWYVVVRRWKVICAINIIFIIFGLLISIIYKPVQATNMNTNTKPSQDSNKYYYQSTASIMVGELPDIKKENVKDIVAINQQYVRTYVALASSRTVSEKALNKMGNNMKFEDIVKGLSVYADQNSQIIYIAYKDEKDDRAVDILNAYVSSFLDEASKIGSGAMLKVIDAPSKPMNLKVEDNKDKQQSIQSPIITQPKATSKKSILLMSMFLGIMTSVGIVLILEYRDDAIRKEDELKMLLKLPVLGVIPAKKDESEAYKVLRTNAYDNKFIKETAESNKGRVYLVISPSNEDGKTKNAVKLTESFSEAGLKTLIVDCNGRNPQLHKIFEVENKNGLSSLLKNKNVSDEYFLATKSENLYVIPWGEEILNPADAFANENMKTIIEKLKESFDCIVIDSSAADEYADAHILSKYADGTIIAATQNKTQKHQLKKLKETIDILDINVIGFVWNESN